jgi:hypothetical protein
VIEGVVLVGVTIDDRAAELNGGSYRKIPRTLRAQAQRECEAFVDHQIESGSGVHAGMPVSAQDLEVADPASAMAFSKLQARIHKYQEFMDQISAAKLELDLARNAFKYRYNMFRPPEVPSKTKHPIRILLSLAGALVGLLLAFGLSTAVDVVSGRFVEPWQVRRRLSLPVSGP